MSPFWNFPQAQSGNGLGGLDFGQVYGQSLLGLLPAGALALLAPGAENLPPAIANFTLGMIDRQLGEEANQRNIQRTNDAIGGLGGLSGSLASLFGNNGYGGLFNYGGQYFGDPNSAGGTRLNLDNMFDEPAGAIGRYRPNAIEGSNVDWNDYRASPSLGRDTAMGLAELGGARLAPGELYARSGFEDAATAKRARGLSDIAAGTQAAETEGRNAVLSNLGGQTGLQDLGGALSSSSMAARRPGAVAAQELESGLTGAEFGARSQLAGQEANINAGLAGQGANLIGQMGLARENILANNIGQLLGARMQQEGLNQQAQTTTEGLRASHARDLAGALQQGNDTRNNFLFNMLGGQQGNLAQLAQLLAGLGTHGADLLAGITENIGSLQAPFNSALGTLWQGRQMSYEPPGLFG